MIEELLENCFFCCRVCVRPPDIIRISGYTYDYQNTGIPLTIKIKLSKSKLKSTLGNDAFEDDT